MAAETKSYEGLMHAGAGTGLVLLQLSALIPGLLPSLALAGLITAVVVLPLLVVGLAATHRQKQERASGFLLEGESARRVDRLTAPAIRSEGKRAGCSLMLS